MVGGHVVGELLLQVALNALIAHSRHAEMRFTESHRPRQQSGVRQGAPRRGQPWDSSETLHARKSEETDDLPNHDAQLQACGLKLPHYPPPHFGPAGVILVPTSLYSPRQHPAATHSPLLKHSDSDPNSGCTMFQEASHAACTATP
ncbi:Hypothetical predicted protein [Pelobates cultripes]|uniref:Uncharacterized protein n=1 Tax=Pelobates cultripes TaxID=61616 RepID=A0AAD1RSB1_PELCU|nr:Hypothetical predicted protein [Pelobates cultripes]